MGYLIPDDWDGETWCAAVVCWPRSDQWNSILNGLITSLTRGRNWDASSGSILSAQEVGYQILDQNIEAGCGMSCLDDLNATLEALVQVTLESSGCGCGGSGGAGGVPQSPSDFEDTGENFPEGYNDRAAYDVAKCNLAQYVINNVLADFDRLKTIDPTVLTLAGVVALLPALIIIPLSYVALAVLAAAIIAFSALGANVFVTAANELRARIAAMDICELYEAPDVNTAIANVEAWIAGGTYTQQTLTVALGQALVGTDLLNPLFNPPDPWLLPEGLPEGDCSGCLECNPWFVDIGTVVSSGPGTLTVQAASHTGLNRIAVYWNVEETAPGVYAYCLPGIELTNFRSTNDLVGGTVEDNPNNTVLDTWHLHPPNGNLPVFPYASVGRVLAAYNSGQTGTMTFTWTV